MEIFIKISKKYTKVTESAHKNVIIYIMKRNKVQALVSYQINCFLLRADVLNVCSFIKFKGETKVEEIKKKDSRSFTTRAIIYCIIYLIAAFILQFKVNSFFCGAVTTFIYAITIDIDARVSAERTMKKLENMKK